MSDKKLVRPANNRLFLGVAAGIANYLNIDVTIVRILWIVAGLLSAGHALLAYLLLAVLMPQERQAEGKYHGFDADEEVIIKDAA